MNVPSYFLIVLGGFAMVWAFRWAKYRKEPKETMGEFEYAAWSAIWGSVLLFVILFIGHLFSWPSETTFTNFVQVPFVISPVIVLVGLIVGTVVGYLFKKFNKR